MNTQIEEERFLIAEKKMQMIQLQAKVDALGSFNSNSNKIFRFYSLMIRNSVKIQILWDFKLV